MLGVAQKRSSNHDFSVVRQQIPPRCGSQDSIHADSVANFDRLTPFHCFSQRGFGIIQAIFTRDQKPPRCCFAIPQRAHRARNFSAVATESFHQLINSIFPVFRMRELVKQLIRIRFTMIKVKARARQSLEHILQPQPIHVCFHAHDGFSSHHSGSNAHQGCITPVALVYPRSHAASRHLTYNLSAPSPPSFELPNHDPLVNDPNMDIACDVCVTCAYMRVRTCPSSVSFVLRVRRVRASSIVVRRV